MWEDQDSGPGSKQWSTLKNQELQKKIARHFSPVGSRVVDPEPDPDWIRIQSGLWIRIRIRNPDPDPGGQK